MSNFYSPTVISLKAHHSLFIESFSQHPTQSLKKVLLIVFPTANVSASFLPTEAPFWPILEGHRLIPILSSPIAQPELI